MKNPTAKPRQAPQITSRGKCTPRYIRLKPTTDAHVIRHMEVIL